MGTLRTQYGKVINPKPSGSAAPKPLTKHQMWLKQSLDFLKNYIRQRATKTNMAKPTAKTAVTPAAKPAATPAATSTPKRQTSQGNKVP